MKKLKCPNGETHKVVVRTQNNKSYGICLRCYLTTDMVNTLVGAVQAWKGLKAWVI